MNVCHPVLFSICHIGDTCFHSEVVVGVDDDSKHLQSNRNVRTLNGPIGSGGISILNLDNRTTFSFLDLFLLPLFLGEDDGPLLSKEERASVFSLLFVFEVSFFVVL